MNEMFKNSLKHRTEKSETTNN